MLRRAFSSTTRVANCLANNALIRVGHIVECARHPDADKLYVSRIDIGAEAPLQVCLGLVNYMPSTELDQRKVCVVTNLKPLKMRGVKLEAMLLAADKDNAVELVDPPTDSEVGQRLWFGKDNSEPATPPRLKPKVWQEIADKLTTNSQGQVVFDQDHILRNDQGQPCTVATLTNASVR